MGSLGRHGSCLTALAIAACTGGDPSTSHAVVLIRNRRGRARRAFGLEGETLVERAAIETRAPDRPHALEMSLLAPSGPLQVAIAAASGGPSMLPRIAAWNDELARLRQP